MAEDNGAANTPLLRSRHDGSTSTSRYTRQRAQARKYLSSKQNHYVIMGLVALDILGILIDIFVTLIACDTGQRDEDWVNMVNDSFQLAGFVFSSLFLVELGLSVWAFGREYFGSWFHCFDGFIIILSFVVDLLARGTVEEIASLIIVLRLWRFVKIVEELSVGASERMEEIEAKVGQLEQENSELRNQLRGVTGGNGIDHGEEGRVSDS